MTSRWPLMLAALLVGACSGGSTPTGPTATRTASAGSAATSTPSTAATPAATQGGGTIGGTVATAADLAKALGPGDFAAVGVSGAGPGDVNNPEPGSVYIVYNGKSSATGGIEFDAFASDTVPDAQASFVAAREGVLDLAGMGKKDLPQADDALMQLDIAIDGGGTWAGVTVRKGRLVFDIGFPSSAGAEAQLTALATLVLQRTTAVQ